MRRKVANTAGILLAFAAIFAGDLLAGEGNRIDGNSPAEALAGLAAPLAADSAGNPELPLIELKGDQIATALTLLPGNSPAKSATRIFRDGLEISHDENLVPQRETAYLDPVAKSLVILGSLAGSPVLEDFRFLTVERQSLVLRDLYLDGDSADISLGRSLPFPLDDLLDGARGSAATAVSPPTITSLAGATSSAAGITNGLADLTCGNSYNGARIVNDQAVTYYWRIKGNNFGSTAGSVKLGSTSASISSWSNTQIDIYPTSSINSTPTTITLKVTTSAGQQTTKAVSIAPSIRTRIYGQCTWYVAWKRLQLGLQPSSSAYGGYSTISASWIPKVGDQLAWNGSHTAIITAVGAPTTGTGGLKTYSLTVGEYNRDCRNNFNSYTTEFQIRTTSGQSSITKYPKSSITSLGNATVYYR